MCSLPGVRQIVALKIDPVESVAHLDNPELTAACQKMKTKTYVGWVFSTVGLFSIDLPYNYFTFYLLHQGLRPKGEKPGSLPEMSIPVLPNTNHPLSRQPFDPGRPLPWDNCYVSHNFSVGGRCPTTWLPEIPPNFYRASIEETVRVASLIDDDIDARNKIIVELDSNKAQATNGDEPDSVSNSEREDAVVGDERATSSLNPLEGLSHTPSESMPGTDIPQSKLPENEVREPTVSSVGSGHAPGGATGDQGSQYAASGSALVELDVHHLDSIVLKVSHDLNAVDGVNEPTEFFQELETFKKLKKELETDRKKKRKIAEARVADEAFFAKLSEKRKDQETPNGTRSEPEPEPEPEPELEPSTEPIADAEPEAEQKSKPSATSRITQRLRFKGLRRKRVPEALHEPAEGSPAVDTKPEPRPNIVFRFIRRAREGSTSASQDAKQSAGVLRRTFCF